VLVDFDEQQTHNSELLNILPENHKIRTPRALCTLAKSQNESFRYHGLEMVRERSDDAGLKSGRCLPLVMLHGLLGGPQNWEPIHSYLPQTCRPVYLRLPFFDEGSGLENVQAVTDYVQRCLDEVKFKRLVLMGNSLGGHIGVLLALNMPERVRGLVLTASGGLFEKGFEKFPGTRPHQQWIREKISEVFYRQCHVSEALVDEIVDITYTRRKSRVLVRLAKSAKRDNLLERLEHITCPTLLIWGKQDRITSPEVATKFHTTIPNSELVLLDKCGHAPMMERPVEFGRTLRRWWEQTF
jgi:2-hydroxy-6-oxonona-2,4-dienedioate hydrolase